MPEPWYNFAGAQDETGIKLDEKYYAGLYSGKKIFAENSNEKTVLDKGRIGISNGIQSNYFIESGEKRVSIIIDEVEYASQNEGIQIVVFDNNYMRVYDAINLLLDESGGILIERIQN